MYALHALLITLLFLWTALIFDFYDATYHLIQALDKIEGFFSDDPVCVTEMPEQLKF